MASGLPAPCANARPSSRLIFCPAATKRRGRDGPRNQVARRRMERLVSNPPARTCIQDSVLCPADGAVRYLLQQVAHPRCALAQVVVVAAERSTDDYQEWIAPCAANAPRGRVSLIDCFSDPCGWKAAWACRQHPAAGAGRGPGASSRPDWAASARGNDVRVTPATCDPSNGFEDLWQTVRAVLTASKSETACGKGDGIDGGEQRRTLVLIDSLSSLVLRSSIQDVMLLLQRLGALADTCVAFVVHTDLHSPDVSQALASASRCLVSVTAVDDLVARVGLALGVGGTEGRTPLCCVHLLRRRDNGTVTTKSQVLEQVVVAAGEGAEVIARSVESAGGVPGGRGKDMGHDSLGLSFNVDVSDAERAMRAAVLLPFQRHLHSVDGPSQDRGKTTGDVEDDLEGVLQDEEDEAASDDDDEEEDPDDDLDI